MTRALIEVLTSAPGAPGATLPLTVARGADPWGEDHQLALYLCYELHYRAFTGVDAGWEWHPAVLGLRRVLEDTFLGVLRAETGTVAPLADQLRALLVEPADGEGPSYFLLRDGERWQAREYLVLRSLYHLKEADPQSWVIPRLHGAAQAALVAVQYDEYGAGHPERTHSRLFADMMQDLGLDGSYGRYLDLVPAPALAVVNLMSLFALHRAHRGALVGQFAGVEITSSPGSARLAAALERFGAGPAGTRFYQEHIEADAVHEQLMRHGVIDALLTDEPGLEEDIAFGLAASVLLDERLAEHALAHWKRNSTALLAPVPAA
ncbi:iron-containing redox enzyme family protein [Kitasatospora indigofera]|uniref:iron-containing redox enzyme family protein n=1 Tax=Kitasatospora indigofera TaxID=67307 RepID=UPI001E3178F3|nr:iron-containing redox enzyme family protein [Kitasatospora indigofera]